MTFRNGPSAEMERDLKRLHRSDPLRLDDGTADRLLRGGMSPDDAPRAYRRVAAMFAGLSAAPTDAELDGERHAVTTIVRHVEAARPVQRRKRPARVAGLLLFGSATLVMGLGAAGALPGAAQNVASSVLGTVGVSTPSPDDHAGTHPDERGRSSSAGSAGTGGTDGPVSVGTTAENESGGTGSTVSGIAQDDSATGVEHGAAVSSEASDDQSQAGQHGQASEGASPPDPGPPADAGPPADPPGTVIADPASDGRSSAGAGNANSGQSNTP
jgi:hypothetical protein